jgi:hypothetical protein
MGKPRLTKIERAIKMINQGASTATIVKSLTVSPQYVYNLRSRLRNAGTIISKKPEQLTLNLEPITPAPIVQQTATVKQATQHLNTIQGEYNRRQQMTTWQRIKAALGF